MTPHFFNKKRGSHDEMTIRYSRYVMHICYNVLWFLLDVLTWSKKFRDGFRPFSKNYS